MKNAIEELNGSVITVVAVASLTVLFFTFVWPLLRENLKTDAKCASAICDDGYIKSGKNEGMAYCYNPKDNKKEVFVCPFRG